MSSYLRVLRYQDFRYLFLGQSASVIGDRVVVVAIALFVTQRTGSPTDLGLVLAAQSLPLVALLLFGGVWADRLPRHRIMVVTDLVRAALHTILAVLIFTGEVEIWQLVVLEAGFGAAQAFFQPAYTGLIPQTVPESMIQDARALTEAMANLAFFLGPALATGLVLGVGAGEAFAFDAATFVLSALLLVRITPRMRQAADVATPVIESLRTGFREVRSRTWVWVTIAVFTGAVLCVYAQWYALAPVISRHVYGGTGVFGLLEGVAGLGAVCGSVLAVRWRPRRPLLTGLMLVLAWPLQSLVFALGLPLALVVVVAFATGSGFSLLMIWWETALAYHIPPNALSRVSAYDWMGSLALVPVGYLRGGTAGERRSARGRPRASAALLGLVMLILALLPRSTRELGGPASAEELTVAQPSSSRAISA